MRIRELKYEDLEKASAVLWKSFYEAEKDHTSMAGMEFFRDATSAVSLSVGTYESEIRLFGAFEDDLVAVGGIKGKSHVLLLYVLPQEAGRGVGSALLAHLERECTETPLTVNAAVPSVSFYEKMGYRVCGEEREEEGQRFIPMIKNIEKS